MHLDNKKLLLIGRSGAHTQAGVCLLQTFLNSPLTGADKLEPSKGDSAVSKQSQFSFVRTTAVFKKMTTDFNAFEHRRGCSYGKGH